MMAGTTIHRIALALAILFASSSGAAVAQDDSNDNLVCCRGFYGENHGFLTRKACTEKVGDFASDEACAPKRRPVSEAVPPSLVCCRGFYGGIHGFLTRDACAAKVGDVVSNIHCEQSPQAEGQASPVSGDANKIKWKPGKSPFDAFDRYDAKSHTYQAGYTQNRQFSGTVDACDLEEVGQGGYKMRWRLSKRLRKAVIGPAVTWKTVWKSKSHSDCKLLLGNERSLDEWLETGEASTFDPSGPQMSAVGPLLPGEGEYRVSVSVAGGGNAMTERTVSIDFNIRDILIALIGDSYAAGEGNPDGFGSVEPTISLGDFNADDIWGTRCQPSTLLKAWEGLGEYIDGVRSPGNINSRYDPANEKSDKKKYLVDMDDDPVWLDISAHRSLRSGHAQAVDDVSRFLSERNGWFVTFVNFAVSGAKVSNLIGEPQNFYHYKLFGLEPGVACDECGQLQELERAIGRRRIDYLIISAGGNDVGFSDALKDATKEDLDDFEFEEKLANLEQLYTDLDRQIEERLDVQEIILTGYPTDLFSGPDRSADKACGLFRIDSLDGAFYSVDGEEIDTLRNWGIDLKKEQQDLAEELGWTFVDVSYDFDGHGYCEADRSYYRSAEGSCIIQGDLQGVMHPNQAGHAVYRKRVGEALRKSLIDRFSQLDGMDWAFEHEF